MTDPLNIVKPHIDTPEEALAKARARRAWIITEDRPAGMRGGSETGLDDPVACTPGAGYEGRYDDPDVLEVAKRAEDARGGPILNPELAEIAHDLHEQNEGAVRQFRFLFQEEYDLEHWHKGEVLWMGDFLTRLQKLNRSFFLAENAYLGLRGLGYVKAGVPVYTGAAVHDGNMPEWSLLKINYHGLPVRELYRGWRTVLLRLIVQGIISEQQAHEEFGKPSGPRARPWWRQLYIVRNGSCPECRKVLCECRDRWDYLRADAHQYQIPDQISAGKLQEAIPRNESRIYVP